MVEILRDQGAGAQIRHMRIWKAEYDNMEVITSQEYPYSTTEWITPNGKVSLVREHRPEEGPWMAYEIDHPFKSTKDYPVIKYIFENTRIVPDLDEFKEKEKMVGEDGMVVTGMDFYSPMQQLMRYWFGYERFFFELHDNPANIDELFQLQVKIAQEKLNILAESSVEIPMLCGNWSDEFHTPVFRKYFMPWLQQASDYLHSKGKLTQVHTDGEMKRLIPFFPETKVDIAEAWSPKPMTKITTAELRKAWGDKVVIWGGIPAILFEPQYTDEEFDAYIMTLFKEVAPGNNFIIGMGDNLPFDGLIERVGRVADLIDEYGELPIEIQ